MKTRSGSMGLSMLGLILHAVWMPGLNETAAALDPRAPDYVLVKYRPERCQEALKLPIDKGLDWLSAQLSLLPGATLREPQINHWLRNNLPRVNTSAVRADLLSGHWPLATDHWLNISTPPGGLMLDRFLYLYLTPELSVGQTVEKLRGHPLVDYIEPDGLGELCLIPSDQWFTKQYQHYIPAYDTQPAQNGLLDTPDAWDITTGSSNVTVAIIDSGIAEEWELNGRLVRGYNVLSNNFQTGTDALHGTIMATILGANANNPLPGSTNDQQGFGIAGMDWQCRLMPIKVADGWEPTRASLGAQGIDFAVTNGCQVILFSAAVTVTNAAESMTLGRSVSNAIARGVIFVCPSGNSYTPISEYPARFAIPIVVGAAKRQDYYGSYLASFSNWGPELTVIAPGESVVGWWNGTSLMPGNGTSTSAALVAGICSLMVSVHPGLTHEQARTLLALGAWDLGAPGFDIYHGWGLANAYNSVLLAATRITRAQPLVGNQWELSWASPTNDYVKKPYLVQFTPSLSGPWLELTNGSFQYERTTVYTNGVCSHQTNRTLWRGEVPLSSSTDQKGYFRVGIRLKK